MATTTSEHPRGDCQPSSVEIVCHFASGHSLLGGVVPSVSYINDHTQRIRRMFKWAAGNELITFDVYQRLTTVSGLRKGRTEARETAPFLPIEYSTVEATLPHLPAVVADMVRIQRLTGCWPGEVCAVRPCDVDTEGDVWPYRPESHNTEPVPHNPAAR